MVFNGSGFQGRKAVDDTCLNDDTATPPGGGIHEEAEAGGPLPHRPSPLGVGQWGSQI